MMYNTPFVLVVFLQCGIGFRHYERRHGYQIRVLAIQSNNNIINNYKC
jgi:hypothetical protein